MTNDVHTYTNMLSIDDSHQQIASKSMNSDIDDRKKFKSIHKNYSNHKRSFEKIAKIEKTKKKISKINVQLEELAPKKSETLSPLKSNKYELGCSFELPTITTSNHNNPNRRYSQNPCAPYPNPNIVHLDPHNIDINPGESIGVLNQNHNRINRQNSKQESHGSDVSICLKNTGRIIGTQDVVFPFINQTQEQGKPAYTHIEETFEYIIAKIRHIESAIYQQKDLQQFELKKMVEQIRRQAKNWIRENDELGLYNIKDLISIKNFLKKALNGQFKEYNKCKSIEFEDTKDLIKEFQDWEARAMIFKDLKKLKVDKHLKYKLKTHYPELNKVQPGYNPRKENKFYSILDYEKKTDMCKILKGIKMRQLDNKINKLRGSKDVSFLDIENEVDAIIQTESDGSPKDKINNLKFNNNINGSVPTNKSICESDLIDQSTPGRKSDRNGINNNSTSPNAKSQHFSDLKTPVIKRKYMNNLNGKDEVILSKKRQPLTNKALIDIKEVRKKPFQQSIKENYNKNSEGGKPINKSIEKTVRHNKSIFSNISLKLDSGDDLYGSNSSTNNSPKYAVNNKFDAVMDINKIQISSVKESNMYNAIKTWVDNNNNNTCRGGIYIDNGKWAQLRDKTNKFAGLKKTLGNWKKIEIDKANCAVNKKYDGIIENNKRQVEEKNPYLKKNKCRYMAELKNYSDKTKNHLVKNCDYYIDNIDFSRV